MNKNKLLGITIGLSIVVLPMLAFAQDSATSSNPNLGNKEDGRPIPTLYEREDRRPAVMPLSAQNQLKNRPLVQNGENGRPPFASSTASTTRKDMEDRIRQQINEKRDELKDKREEVRGEIKDLQEQRREDRKELRVDIFKMQQDKIVEQLTRSLNNLKQVRGRIQDRITKVENEKVRRDMTTAKTLLITADGKIAAAEKAIASFSAYVPTASSTIISTSTASSTATTTHIQLERPRQIGADAIKAVKAAKDALQDVVRAIAHSMGFRLGDDRRNATSTATSTTTTSTSTATTTTV